MQFSEVHGRQVITIILYKVWVSGNGPDYMSKVFLSAYHVHAYDRYLREHWCWGFEGMLMLVWQNTLVRGSWTGHFMTPWPWKIMIILYWQLLAALSKGSNMRSWRRSATSRWPSTLPDPNRRKRSQVSLLTLWRLVRMRLASGRSQKV